VDSMYNVLALGRSGSEANTDTEDDAQSQVGGTTGGQILTQG